SRRAASLASTVGQGGGARGARSGHTVRHGPGSRRPPGVGESRRVLRRGDGAGTDGERRPLVRVRGGATTRGGPAGLPPRVRAYGGPLSTEWADAPLPRRPRLHARARLHRRPETAVVPV